MKENNIDNFQDYLLNYDWKYVYDNIDLNILFEKFIHDIENIFNESCPIIKVKYNNKKNKPWIYYGLIKCIKKKNKLFKQTLNNNSIKKKNHYKKYKNILTSVLRYPNTFKIMNK